MSKLSQKSKM